jgi:hypothetical protein
MIRITALLTSCSLLALGACAVVPPGPTVQAMPGPGKTFDAFQQDDGFCRQVASQSTGGLDANTAAAQSGVGTAVVGTALGAATGALIGAAAGNPAAGAAIGAGAGLLTGTVAGGVNAQAAGNQVQFRYDDTYAHCMFAHGNTVSQPQPAFAGGPGFYGAPGPVLAAAGPAFVAPPVVVGGLGWYRPWWRRGWYGGYYWR